ncbi:NADH-quinone oxidoreductase subunit K [Marinitenerispora sediminis]|uniref:Sodium:proton antiporter n=1 Tax=Marinitenerispora sediminis TaxID=1931232 RepID=A0A368TDW0_9ACTN|nr:NADH-quinone oxidoreductase subunit K [Marinitenerispora sediminis]RCV56988.1 sodium:proton antiporter [Marinitenerispora sediminis]RCV60193.1 sodium:proton antiporter [Marinitenerispora sediminis]RCV62100.1 sodium:proton antiporter [Marinitenerispora sediminis]
MSTPSFILVVTVAVLYSGGFYLLLQRSLMRVVFGILMLGHAANMSLLLTDEAITLPPLLGGASGEMSDPLPHAMALTAIVITFGVTTFLLALAYRVWLGDENDEVPDDVEDRRIRRLTEPEDSS